MQRAGDAGERLVDEELPREGGLVRAAPLEVKLEQEAVPVEGGGARAGTGGPASKRL